MKLSHIIGLILVFTYSGSVFAQNTVGTCFKKPETFFVRDMNLKNEAKLPGYLKSMSGDLSKDERLFIYVYSQGSFGTKGLGSLTNAARVIATQLFQSDKRFEIREGGYRTEASIDIFALGKECQALSKDFDGDPDTNVNAVDFADAPLGESVFPDGDQFRELLLKKVDGNCYDDVTLCGYVGFYIIVDKDGRVMFARPEPNADPRLVSKARQILAGWSFKAPVIDGTTRYIRTGVTVTFWWTPNRSKP